MNNIIELFAEWQSLQPLNDSNQKRLDQKFMLEFNYNSNHIEGNTLTYGQTEMLLMFGKVVNDANMKDLEEMKASNVGLTMVREMAKDKEQPLSEYFIRTLHHTLLREDYTEHRQRNGVDYSYIVHAGQYKTRPNSVKTITGELFEYASPEETPALMTDLLQWYNQAEEEAVLSPIELASLFHYRYIRIHPFEDGNGRVSRLIVNYILYRHRYPMIVVKSSDKSNYLTALNKCDLLVGQVPSVGAHATIEQIKPFVDYLSGCLERALIISIKAGKGESIEEEDDFEKKLKIIERNARIKVPENAHVVTPQDKIKVFDDFHRKLADRLLSALEPAKTFYNSMTVHYFMTKDRDRINQGSFFDLKGISSLSSNISEQQMRIINDAQCIMLNITFDGVNSKYKMKDRPIFIRASVYYELTTYSFDGQSYPYGTYPAKSVIDEYIRKTKNMVLQIIENAIE